VRNLSDAVEWSYFDNFSRIVGSHVIGETARDLGHEITDLEPGNRYYIRVRAGNATGFGPPAFSTPSSATPSSKTYTMNFIVFLFSFGRSVQSNNSIVNIIMCALVLSISSSILGRFT